MCVCCSVSCWTNIHDVQTIQQRNMTKLDSLCTTRHILDANVFWATDGFLRFYASPFNFDLRNKLTPPPPVTIGNHHHSIIRLLQMSIFRSDLNISVIPGVSSDRPDWSSRYVHELYSGSLGTCAVCWMGVNGTVMVGNTQIYWNVFSCGTFKNKWPKM